MKDLSLHILDVAENSVRAGARLSEILITDDAASGFLTFKVIDNGCGMDDRLRREATSPFTTTKSDKGVGLGLALLAQATQEADGTLTIESALGKGTSVTATFKRDHIDRKPIGDLAGTFKTLAAANPQIDFVIRIEADGTTQCLDTRELMSKKRT